MKISIWFLLFVIISLTRCTDNPTNTNQNPINPNFSYGYRILQADTSFGALRISVYTEYTEIFWHTIFEINNSGWEIEKGESRQTYIPIYFMNGRGTTSEIHNYYFKDYGEFSKIFFYRFKQINFDGSSNIFLEVEVTIH